MWKIFHLAVVVTMITVVGTLSILYVLGITYNRSNSVPTGIYISVNKKIEVGDYVVFCPYNTDITKAARARGYIKHGVCDGGYEQMIKQIRAIEGDNVNFISDGLYVNGNKVLHSKIYMKDISGRPLPQPKFNSITLNVNEYLVMGENNDLSFDSRYFGPIKRDQIISIIKPLYVF